MYFSGFNAFHQFGPAHARRVLVPTEFKLSDILDENGSTESSSDLQVSGSWSYNAYALKNEVILSGFVTNKSDTTRRFRTVDIVKKIIATDNYTLILLENGELFKLSVHKFISEKLNFTTVEQNRKRNIFGNPKQSSSSVDPIEHIAANVHFALAITKSNAFYSIPSKIFQFPQYEKIVSLVCGFEHALILTANGDVYSWGEGLRGQLGQETVQTLRTPAIVDALAGIKIVAIAAGGWHSAAISAFGDLYMWGFNTNGQLGLKLYDEVLKKKNPSVFLLPQLIDLPHCCCPASNKVITECKAASSEEKINDNSRMDAEISECYTNHPIVKATETEEVTTSTEIETEKRVTTSSSEANGKSEEASVPVTAESMEVVEIATTESSNGKTEEGKSVTVEKDNVETVEIGSSSPSEMGSTCNVVKVFCGARHTVIQMACGKLFATGWNENGQLGLGSEDGSKDTFTQVRTITGSVSDVICGHWCTIFKIKT